MKTFQTLSLVALLSAATALTAAAQMPGGPMGGGGGGPMMGRGHGGPGGPDAGPNWRAQRMMEILDTNKDGKITADEIAAEQRRMLAAVDVDGDGAVSVEEFRRRGQLLMSVGATSMFDMLDTNGDGKITIDELTAPSRRWFGRYDANKDGGIEASEMPDRPSMRGMGPGRPQ